MGVYLCATQVWIKTKKSINVTVLKVNKLMVVQTNKRELLHPPFLFPQIKTAYKVLVGVAQAQ